MTTPLTQYPSPLEGVRVLDLGTRISAPFCAGLLGELGAEVIKVEEPRRGDMMRSIGPFEDGYSIWWAVEGRGRKSVTCNLRTEEGQALMRRLVERADVLVENFRPGTMERWGLGPADLSESLVYVRVSGFGQSGPYAMRPALDRVGIAYGGLFNITGDADGPPMRPGVNLSDYLSGLFAALGAVAALRRRAVDPSCGEVVDSSLYGSVMRILEWSIAAYDRLGLVRGRQGNRFVNAAPGDAFPTADGKYVSIVAAGDVNFARLCVLMGRSDLVDDVRFATIADRAEASDELNGIVADWVAERTASEVVELCIENEVPVGVAYTVADIVADPHVAARDDIVAVEDPVLGPVCQQAPQPRLLRSVSLPLSGAPRLGEHNEEVWCDLVGLKRSELADAQRAGVV